MNRNTIKYIAIIAMLMDHIAITFIPSNTILYFLFKFVGRIAAPIMCYFLVEGYRYTLSKYKYAKRLLVFGIISQIPYTLSFHNKILSLDFNMILTLFICLIVLYVYDNIYDEYLKWFVLLCLIILTSFCDWNYFAPIFVLIFYIFKSDKNRQVRAYIISSVLFMIASFISCAILDKGLLSETWQIGIFIFIPIVKIYNGESGKKTIFNKWFFYVFYPAHLLVIWIIKNYIL